MNQADVFELDGPIQTGIKRDDAIIVYPFDKYRIEVMVDADGRFLGITGICIKKDFVPIERGLSRTGYLDLSKAYPEDSEEDFD